MVDGPELHAVRIAGVAARRVIESEQQVADLAHELRLLQTVEDESPRVTTPLRVLSVIEGVLSAFGDARSDAYLQAQAALDRGEETFDLRLELPKEAATASRALLKALEDADDCAREGQLLTPAASTGLRDFRRWYSDAVVTALAQA